MDGTNEYKKHTHTDAKGDTNNMTTTEKEKKRNKNKKKIPKVVWMRKEKRICILLSSEY